MAERLRCVVERITYQNAENGYSVIKCAAKGFTDLMNVVGAMTIICYYFSDLLYRMEMSYMKKRFVFLLFIASLLVRNACAEIPFDSRSTLHGNYDSNIALPDETITKLLSAAFSMPTGGNQRALDFFVVTDRETMLAMKGGNPYSQAMDSAPCVIVVTADTEGAYYDELLEMDAGLAAGAILLQSADLGMSTCVLSIAPQQERIRSVRAALNMDDSLYPILMVAVGYPRAEAVTSASVDNWVDSQVHWMVQE